MYHSMKLAMLLMLPVLISAAPATRPAVERIGVQVRSLEFTRKADAPALDFGNVPADATEVSSIEVAAVPGEPFEATATVNGVTYKLSGQLKRLPNDEQYSVAFEYIETSGEQQKSIAQITSKILAAVDKPTQIGGLLSGDSGTAMILTLKRAEPSPR